MRAARGGPRWAMSFADLSLLLLGFFVLLQARPAGVPLSGGFRAAFALHAPATLERPARLLFEPGEAVLRPSARRLLRDFAHGAGSVEVSSRGTEPATRRLDGWELAAARVAAIGREMTAAGVSEGRVTVAIDPATGGGQLILLSRE